MGEADALTGAILYAGPAEQVENPLMILLIDAAAVVRHLIDNVAGLSPARDLDVARNARIQVLQRIVDQVREDLFKRQAIADYIGQRSDPDLGICLLGLMRDGFGD